MIKRDTEELVREYCRTRDLEIRDMITLQLSGLVESAARKFVGSGEPIEDLIQEGYLGLLNALATVPTTRVALHQASEELKLRLK